uniref:Uncharacterized protein n=1 Tax=Arundo donax TaxID=35708 RepID=A0A0A9CTB9_ARUDO
MQIMKIDDERPYHSHVFHELASNGSPKLDLKTERETKHTFLADKMVEQTNQSENNFMKSERQDGGKIGQTRIEDVSYEKDVVEIKLPATVISSDYGGHFVKDVCIDDGVPADQKASTEKLADQKVSPNVDSSMGDTNGVLNEEIRAESTKSEHELKSQVVILPVMCAIEGNTEEQYSSCEVRGHEGNNTAAVFTSLNDDKLSPKQLICHEGAKGCHQVVTVISESSENQEPFLNGEATHQVYYYLYLQ